MLTAALIAEVALVWWRAVGAPAPGQASAAAGRPPVPLPSELTVPVVFFASLSVVAGINDDVAHLAGLFGWGIVAATALNLLPGVAASPKKGTQS